MIEPKTWAYGKSESGYLYDILSCKNRHGNIIIPHSNHTLAKIYPKSSTRVKVSIRIEEMDVCQYSTVLMD